MTLYHFKPDYLSPSVLGGGNTDAGYAIAVDSAGSAYVTGRTVSTNFPTTLGAFDTSYNGDVDVFVAKLNAGGSALTYATFIGGSSDDFGAGIAVDGLGSAYVTGATRSYDFPTTPGTFATSYNGGTWDAVVAKLNPAGSALAYATFLGGDNDDHSNAIAVDGLGSAHVTGFTRSTNFPTTPGAFDTSYNGGYNDVFVAKLNAGGSALVYATFIGGSSDDFGAGIAVDGEGSAYVTGTTTSTNFPTTSGAFDTSHNGYQDAFVTKLVVEPLIDAAELASQSEYLTVAPGAAISPWIVVGNTGTTTWTPAQYGYNGKGALQGTTGYITRNVAPGDTYRFFWNLTAPTTPGVYDYGFVLRHGTQEFGPYFFVRVTVVPAKWTLMYYLAGDNEFDTGMAATISRLENQIREAHNPYVKVVVLYDGHVHNDSAYYVIESSGTTRIPKAELNTGDPQTLADFVTWVKANHSAEHFALVIAGHGNGISGVAPDDSAGNPITGPDYLFLRELRDAVSSKVDVIYMRACLMGMIEPAYELRDKMDFYVASQTYMVTAGRVPVPLELGLEIPVITNSTTPVELSLLYFNAYKQQYLTWQPGAISVLDMSKFTTLVSKVNALAQALTENMGTERAILLSLQDVSRLQHFDMDGNYTLNSRDEYVDLYDFAVQLRQATNQSSVASAALELEIAVQQIVGGNTYSTSGAWKPQTPQNDHSKAHGISIFWPSQRRSFLNMNWSSWADGVSSWLPQSVNRLAPDRQVNEATNAWMQSLIDFTNQTNPTDNPNAPSPVVLRVDYPYNQYLPLVEK